MRTAILADKLLERGHNVFWWASAFEHQQKVMIAGKDRNFDISERYAIRVLRGCKYRKNISLARYIDHQIVALKISNPIEEISQTRYHSGINAGPSSRVMKRRDTQAKNHIPFLVDIRDLWPDIFLNRF